MNNSRYLFWAKILLTVTALEFFGPTIRDFGASHAFNPNWVGHARVHLVWLLGFMVLSGFVNLYLLWFRRPDEIGNVRLSAAWQAANLGGFWIAYFLSPVYDGKITVPGIHTHVFGIDENVFAFGVFSVLWIVACTLIRKADAETH